MNPVHGCRAEQSAWRDVQKGWQTLYGDFDRLGVSVEWHDFQTEYPLDWGRSFHPQSIEFCWNLQGRGAVGGKDEVRGDYVPGSSGYYALTDEPVAASRTAHERHRFVTLEFSRSHLQTQLAESEGDLDPQMRAAIFPGKEASVVSKPRLMSSQERDVVVGLTQPPVPKAAQALWYQSKALELMSHFLFTPKDPEFFCMRQKRVARDRVERAKELLTQGPGESAHPRDARPGSGLQSVLSKPDFFARSRPDHSAILAKPTNGTRGGASSQRSLQCDGGGDGSRLLEPEPFQQSVLRTDRLLSGALSDGEKCGSRSLTTTAVAVQRRLNVIS